MMTVFVTSPEQQALVASLKIGGAAAVPRLACDTLDLQQQLAPLHFRYVLRELSFASTVFFYCPHLEENLRVGREESLRLKEVAKAAATWNAILVLLTEREMTESGEPFPYEGRAGGASEELAYVRECYVIGNVRPEEYALVGRNLVALSATGYYGRYNWRGNQLERVAQRFTRDRSLVG